MAGRAASPGVGNQRRDAGSRAPSLSSSQVRPDRAREIVVVAHSRSLPPALLFCQLDGLDLTLAESYMLVNGTWSMHVWGF